MKYKITFIAEVTNEAALIKAFREQSVCRIEGIIQQAQPLEAEKDVAGPNDIPVTTVKLPRWRRM